MPSTNHVWAQPAPGVAPKPRIYTPEQQHMIDELRKYAESIMLPQSDPYYVHEHHWLLNDPECCGRYMRAAKWKVDDGKKRIQKTLAWRREYKPDLIPPEEVRIESETGKMFFRERAINLMPPHQDSMMIIVDYKSTTLRTNPSIGVARKVLAVLQDHYVERLGRAIVVNLPVLLNFFYKGISPFLDPITRDKMRFNPNLQELVPTSQLDATVGGDFKYEFEPTSYWEQIVSLSKLNPDGSHRWEPTLQTAEEAAMSGVKADLSIETSFVGTATPGGATPELSTSVSSRASTVVAGSPITGAEKGEGAYIMPQTRLVEK
ncbi:hypothetical protein CTheo_6169 [Ceratobasidium theobromae]|uniref:CRAL-TRIO domain-containing protein n=1 Tax=Ceratobasidium theobromae TaxID=1582974 RepID=A0A5N5QFU5_9AGAM|nr:hypothetical protein CTheo_6169 [Ceratobasidium theobromae]